MFTFLHPYRVIISLGIISLQMVANTPLDRQRFLRLINSCLVQQCYQVEPLKKLPHTNLFVRCMISLWSACGCHCTAFIHSSTRMYPSLVHHFYSCDLVNYFVMTWFCRDLAWVGLLNEAMDFFTRQRLLY